jgi:hypothetical protein
VKLYRFLFIFRCKKCGFYLPKQAVVDEQEEWEERIEQADRNRETQVKKQSLIFKLLRSPRIDSKEPIPPGCVAWRACTTTLFLLGSPIYCLKIPALE